MSTGDDAGVFALGDGRALVQTVDIFTPVVDSARDWGRIAAANALADVYAMGANPLTALQYLAWPRDELPLELATEVIEGGMELMAQAGCTVVGGHSIDSPEPTYGFAVTGVVSLDQVVTNAGGRPGDVLVLTKPLGMGIITTAIKRGKCPKELAEEAIEWMTALNAPAGGELHDHKAHAATDISGYGLLGHLHEVCRTSGVGAEIELHAVPILAGVSDLVALGMWPGGSQRNLESVSEVMATDFELDLVKPLIDAQTSGGLLVALPAETADPYAELVGGTVIGRLTEDMPIRVI